MLFKILLWIIIGYIIGSIAWGLWIGLIFFHKDIRKYGSGNTGGTNAGRVLGKPIGLLVIFLDAMKAFIIMALCSKFAKEAVPYAGIAVSVGHCFPCFAEFKGGKGVACGFGYLLGLCCFFEQDFIFLFVYPILVFLLILGLSRMVSLSSICGLTAATIISYFVCDLNIFLCILLLTILVIYRHHSNIERIIQGKESKVSFIK